MYEEQTTSFSFFLFCTLFGMFCAWKTGYFSWGPLWKRKGSLLRVLGAFTLYFSCRVIIEPIVLIAIFYVWNGKLPHTFSEFSLQTLAATHFTGMFLAAGLLLWYSRSSWSKGLKIFGFFRIKDFCVGAAFWLLAFPAAAAMGQAMAIVLYKLFGENYIPNQQAAVKYVKSLAGQPYLISFTAFAVVVLVPIAEELLFRGFLQSWLVQYFRRTTAVLISAAVFSLLHFSSDQGSSNWELLPSLFILGIFLGFLYEKQKSLLTPIALHSTFNSITLFIIFL